MLVRLPVEDGFDRVVVLDDALRTKRTALSSPDHGCSRRECEPGADDVPEWTPMRAVVYLIKIAGKARALKSIWSSHGVKNASAWLVRNGHALSTMGRSALTRVAQS